MSKKTFFSFSFHIIGVSYGGWVGVGKFISTILHPTNPPALPNRVFVSLSPQFFQPHHDNHANVVVISLLMASSSPVHHSAVSTVLPVSSDETGAEDQEPEPERSEGRLVSANSKG